MALQVRQVHVDQQVRMVPQVLRVMQVRWDQQVLQVRWERLVYAATPVLELLARKVKKVSMANVLDINAVLQNLVTSLYLHVHVYSSS